VYLGDGGHASHRLGERVPRLGIGGPAGLQSQLVKTLGATTPVAELAKKLATIPPQQLIYFQRSKIAIEELFRSHVEVRLPTVSAQTVAVRELLRGQILAFRSLRAGELKRLSIGVELAANQPVLLLDEPTSGLDARAAAVVVRVLKTIAQRGRTVRRITLDSAAPSQAHHGTVGRHRPRGDCQQQ
jgi:ABC-type cobalamin/Fe3+-siderophores transport system ATPase subunit